jgi:Spy/CpxP family protein refolding chaperone
MKVVLFRTALTLACAAALAATSLAQAGSGNSPHSHNRLSRLQKALNLSDNQVNQLQGLFQSQAANMKPYRADVRAKRQALQTALQGTDTSAIGSAALALKSSRAALKQARQANEQAMLAVLTPDQARIMKDYQTVARAGGGFGPRSWSRGRFEARS